MTAAPSPRLVYAWAMRTLWIVAAAAAALFAAVGCSAGAARETPPAGLRFLAADAVAKERADKDASFRSDADSPIPPEARASFKGLDYYPFDPAARFAVKLRRFPQPVPLTIVTTRGVPRPAEKVGYVEFPMAGATRRLTVYRLKDLAPKYADELFLPFLDATSGVETYGAGRYVDLAPGPAGWYVLDFNLAYHPLCAYGRTIYRCPRTPEENRLPFAVRAGERGWAVHAAAPSGAGR